MAPDQRFRSPRKGRFAALSAAATRRPQTCGARFLLPALRWSTLCLCAVLLAACGSLSQTKEGEGPRRTWSGTGGGAAAAKPDAAAVQPQAVQPEGIDPLLKAHVFEALAEMKMAQAKGDAESAEAALDQAMEGVRLLMQEPAMREDAEVRELYRSTITAYEQYYGTSDSLAVAYGDIFAFREEMFATLNQLDEPLRSEDAPLVAAPSAARPLRTTVPLERNRLVQQSMQYLLRTPEKHIDRWRYRAGVYFPMIEQILREENVPDELKYLAMIESGLNPKARSHAGAVGMWQFMPATGKAYGLRITSWVDERSNPEKSTRAAARHLRDLYAEFGDWHLVLAAYNCGSGRVSRALSRFKAREGRRATFWDIYDVLPRETRNYVPMFIAATLVASQPQAYGLRPVEPGPRYAYDAVPVEGMLDLRRAAELAGSDAETLRSLNPEIRQWATPPSGTYHLRIPQGRAAAFRAAYAALPPEERRGASEYVVRRGDTLGKIARRYGTTVTSLQQANGLRGSLIQVGQRLYVPGGSAAAGLAASESHGGTPVRAASFSGAGSGARAAASSGASSTRIHYRVRRGDNLTEIARRYDVTVAELKAWNSLRTDRIRSGQVLTLHTRGGRPAGAGGGPSTYTVRRGDNLTEIARRHGVSVRDVRRWNGLRSDRIYPGQQLTVHGGGGGAQPSSQWTAYRVQRGDTLAAIAEKHGTTVAELRRWNDLRSDRIRVGQRLAIYMN